MTWIGTGRLWRLLLLVVSLLASPASGSPYLFELKDFISSSSNNNTDTFNFGMGNAQHPTWGPVPHSIRWNGTHLAYTGWYNPNYNGGVGLDAQGRAVAKPTTLNGSRTNVRFFAPYDGNVRIRVRLTDLETSGECSNPGLPTNVQWGFDFASGGDINITTVNNGFSQVGFDRDTYMAAGSYAVLELLQGSCWAAGDATHVEFSVLYTDSVTVSSPELATLPDWDVRVIPNPINDHGGAIQFALPEASRTRLGVFDAGGRRVESLFLGDLSAGSHEVSWSPRLQSLPSGVYFVRLESSRGTETAKLVVSR